MRAKRTSPSKGTRKQLGKISLQKRLVPTRPPDAASQSTLSHAAANGDQNERADSTAKVQTRSTRGAVATESGAIDLATVRIRCDLLKLLPREVAKRHRALIMDATEQEVCVALPDVPNSEPGSVDTNAPPRHKKLIDEIEFVTGRQAQVFAADAELLAQTIELAYNTADQGADWYEATADQGLSAYVPSGQWLTIRAEDCSAEGLTNAVTQLGKPCVFADTLTQALTTIANEVPRLLISTWQPEKQIGLSFFQRLHDSARYNHIPILVLQDAQHPVPASLVDQLNFSTVCERTLSPQELQGHANKLVAKSADAWKDFDAISLRNAAHKAELEAATLCDNGHIDAALQTLRDGLVSDSLYFPLQYQLGLLFGHQERYHEAIETLEFAMQLQGDDFGVTKNLALMYERVGFPNKAFGLWERALRCAPNQTVRDKIEKRLTEQ